MKTLKVGIATLDQYKARTMAIARGEYVPAAGAPVMPIPVVTRDEANVRRLRRP